jgi:hypothetical protein
VSAEVANVAWPNESRVAVPSRVAPSLKLTLPEGFKLVAAVGCTDAVKVTGEPNPVGLALAVIPVTVPTVTPTIWATEDEVLDAKFGSPLYVAVIEWAPGPRFIRVSVAVGEISAGVSSCLVAIAVAPS